MLDVHLKWNEANIENNQIYYCLYEIILGFPLPNVVTGILFNNFRHKVQELSVGGTCTMTSFLDLFCTTSSLISSAFMLNVIFIVECEELWKISCIPRNIILKCYGAEHLIITSKKYPHRYLNKFENRLYQWNYYIFITMCSRCPAYQLIYYLCWPVKKTGTSPTK